MGSNKLELNWLGKDDSPRLEPRVLIESPAISHHAPHRVSKNDEFGNRVIFGDNLLALRALEHKFVNEVKCVFIDPPYNTGNENLGYPDGIEHSLWLGMMRERISILYRLLANDGSIWISLDDNEVHYLKIVLDEVFGRNNFVASVIWQKIYTTKNSAKYFSSMHDYILVYAKNKNDWKIGALPRTAKQDDAYTNPDNDERGPWKATPLHARNKYSAGRYSITSPSGREIKGPPSGTYWRVSETTFLEMVSDNRIWWGSEGDGIPSQKRFLTDVKQGVTPATLWLHQDAGHNAEAKNEVRSLFPNDDELFLTPKPERLIRQILELSTKPGDLVLDSFAGSGTTGAVAHKMNRRWIMVELEDHCHTCIVPRMIQVVDGTDSGGITESVGWQGGGGFRYFKLAPSLLSKDEFNNWVISEEYNAELLAQAVCKIEGFTYSPTESSYWQHGYSTESDFIYVTTQTLTRQQLEALAEDVGPNRSLMVYCTAFRVKKIDDFPNLTIKKIPKAVLHKCEWGKDDYSLEIGELPPAPDYEEPDIPSPRKRKRKETENQATLFTMEGDQ